MFKLLIATIVAHAQAAFLVRGGRTAVPQGFRGLSKVGWHRTPTGEEPLWARIPNAHAGVVDTLAKQKGPVMPKGPPAHLISVQDLTANRVSQDDVDHENQKAAERMEQGDFEDVAREHQKALERMKEDAFNAMLQEAPEIVNDFGDVNLANQRALEKMESNALREMLKKAP